MCLSTNMNGHTSAAVTADSGRHQEWHARSSILSQPGMNRMAVSATTVNPARSSMALSARRE